MDATLHPYTCNKNYSLILLRNQLILPFTSQCRSVTSDENAYQRLQLDVCHLGSYASKQHAVI